MTIEIRPVVNAGDRRTFIRLQWTLYKNDPNWVPPLIEDMKNVFNVKKNALLSLGPYQYFLAYSDCQPVGRIGVGMDNHLNEVKKFKSAYLTLFECINDFEVAKTLLDTALSWVKEQGAEFITGPQSPTNGDDFRGLLIQGYDTPPALMNSYNPPYYQMFFEQYGFTKQFDRNAYYIDITHSEIPEKFLRGVEYAKKRYGFRIAKLDMKHFDAHVDAVAKILVKSWPENWPDMVPPTSEEITAEVAKLKPLIDPELVYFAWDKNNQPISVAITLPNYNEVLQKMNGRLWPTGWLHFLLGKKKIKSARIFVLMTIPEYHSKGVSSSIYLEAVINAKKMGYEWADGSSIHDFNVKMNQDAIGAGGKLYKVFRVYLKDLIPPEQQTGRMVFDSAANAFNLY